MPLIIPRSAAALGAAAILLLAAPAAAQGAAAQADLDHVWLMTATSLVLLMQVGFLLLETGLTRSKNSINVAQKNLLDLSLSLSLFWVVGFAFMFGPSFGALGFGGGLVALAAPDPPALAFFVFQAMFCGTAVTIMSGAAAERFTFSGFALVTALTAAVTYPIYGHWVWGGLLVEGNSAWLADLGFIDFAGSTVVHALGAWVALAVIVVIGPRRGRFDAAGKPIPIAGHSPMLSGAGALLLFVGWIGFNGGSALVGTAAFAGIVLNTVVAAALGGVGGFAYGRIVDAPHLKVERMINGLLGGLVAITAGCAVLDARSAALVGLLGGAFANHVNDLLARRLRLDDVAGAVGVHGAAGALGTVLLALLMPAEALAAGSRLQQLLVQVIGVALSFVWAFGVTFGALWLIGRVVRLRVSAEDEETGLNATEHGATLSEGLVEQLLARRAAEKRRQS